MAIPQARQPRDRTALALALHTATVLFTLPQVALAHPAVNEGVRRYEGADFGGALEVFEEAESASDLTRSDLVTLLETRALVHYGLEAHRAMEEDLRVLAALAPDHAMGPAVSPEVREAFDRLREGSEQLALSLTAEPVPGGLRVKVEIVGDPGGLVQVVRLHGRVVGSGWTTVTGSELMLPSGAGAAVEYYADATGPGGAPVCGEGTREQPRRFVPAAGRGGAGAGAGGPGLDDEDDSTTMALIVGGGLIAVAATVLVVLLATSGPTDDTQFDGPAVRL